jgi:hypothetical protein
VQYPLSSAVRASASTMIDAVSIGYVIVHVQLAIERETAPPPRRSYALHDRRSSGKLSADDFLDCCSH